MKKRILSVVLSLALLVGSLAVIAVTPAAAAANYSVTEVTSQNKDVIPKDNLLADAVEQNIKNVTNGHYSYSTVPVENMFNGNIQGITQMDTNTTVIYWSSEQTVYYYGHEGDQDYVVPKVTGLSTLAFKLAEVSTFDQFLVAGSYADNPEFSATVDNRNVRYYQIYVGNDLATLFSGTPVVDYNNAKNPGLCQLIKLNTALTAEYVGFKLTGGSSSLARIGQIGVYSSTSTEKKLQVGCTQITSRDADLVPSNNLLADAADQNIKDVTTNSNNGDNKPFVADNDVPGITQSEKSAAATFWANGSAYFPGHENDEQYRIPKTSGWSVLAFKLAEISTFDTFLVAGSFKDEVGTSYDNRNIRYYEIYVSDSLDTLFSSTPVVTFDNSTALGLCQIHVLSKSVTAEYVGFKLTGGQYGLSRIGELGVYADGTADKTLKLVCVGDSITEGTHFPNEASGDWTTATYENSYPTVLCKLLNEWDKDNTYSVYNAGIGASCAVGCDLLDSKLNDEYLGWRTHTRKPNKIRYADILTIMLGTNDAGSNWDARKVLYNEEYKKIVSAYKAINPNLKLVVISSPCTLREPWYTSLSTDIIAMQKSLAEELGATFVDVFTPTKKLMDEGGEGAFIDAIDIKKGVRLHPDEQGHALLAGLIFTGMTGATPVNNDLPFTKLDTEDAYNSFMDGKVNLLKGAAVEGKTFDYLLPSNLNLENGKVSDLTDDYIGWTAEGANAKILYNNGGGGARPFYDLRGKAKISGVMIANYALEETKFRVNTVKIYVSNSENDLYADTSLVGTAKLAGAAVANYIDLSACNAEGRYIGFNVAGDALYGRVRMAELGVYGTYTGTIHHMTKTLLQLDTTELVERFEIPARSIDNCTAVDANGNPGKGNTGTTGKQLEIWRIDGDLSNLTDGDFSSRSTQYLHYNEDWKENYVSHYNTPWIVFVYYLGGYAHIDSIDLCSGDSEYAITGVQYYASEKRADLFKNESLLYTTGGEKFVKNEGEFAIDNGDEYVFDPRTESYDRHQTYELTKAQSDKQYRYVAIVMTRPGPQFVTGTKTQKIHYNLYRVGELTVEGKVITPEKPVNNLLKTSTGIGEFSVIIKPYDHDDRDFFANLGKLVVVEEAIPAGAKRNLYNNWLTVDGDKMYHLYLTDKKGQPITQEVFGTREIEYRMPPTGKYMQTAARYVDGQFVRIYNSYTVQEGYVKAGTLNYPIYADIPVNNRKNATLQTPDIRLVYLKYNDIDTINALNNDTPTTPLRDFRAVKTAGVQDHGTSAIWFVLTGVVPVGVAAAVLLILRKKRKSAASREQ